MQLYFIQIQYSNLLAQKYL